MSNDFRIDSNWIEYISNQSNMDSLVLPKLSYKIVGTLFKVHNELGPSLLEKHYQRAIEKEFIEQRINFKKEFSVDLKYKSENIGKYFLDFLVEGKVILETKAVKSYNPKFFKQVLSYLKVTKLPLAIMTNFRRERLMYRRVINPDFQNIDLTDFDKKFE